MTELLFTCAGIPESKIQGQIPDQPGVTGRDLLQSNPIMHKGKQNEHRAPVAELQQADWSSDRL